MMSDRAAKILAFPALQAIPQPEFPLQGVAHDKYMELAKALLNVKKLNQHTRSTCERIAILHAQVHKRVELGQNVPRATVEEIGKLMKELRLVDESDDTPAQGGPGTENRYARIGIITLAGTEKA